MWEWSSTGSLRTAIPTAYRTCRGSTSLTAGHIEPSTIRPGLRQLHLQDDRRTGISGLGASRDATNVSSRGIDGLRRGGCSVVPSPRTALLNRPSRLRGIHGAKTIVGVAPRVEAEERPPIRTDDCTLFLAGARSGARSVFRTFGRWGSRHFGAGLQGEPVTKQDADPRDGWSIEAPPVFVPMFTFQDRHPATGLSLSHPET